jgi:HSP20 family protein
MKKAKEVNLKELLGPLEEEMDFFFSSFFGNTYPNLYRHELYWKPPTDAYETESNFVIILELAQIDPKDVTITLQENILYIRGARKAIPSSEKRRYHKMEINYGPFERRIIIPEEIDMDKLTAAYNNGFLEIKLPKKQNPSSGIVKIEVD